MVNTPVEGSVTISSKTSSSTSVPELSMTLKPSVTGGTPNFAKAKRVKKHCVDTIT